MEEDFENQLATIVAPWQMRLEGSLVTRGPDQKGDSHPPGDYGSQAHLEVKEGEPHRHGPCAIQHPFHVKVAASCSL